jgi:hypothetical protein
MSGTTEVVPFPDHSLIAFSSNLLDEYSLANPFRRWSSVPFSEDGAVATVALPALKRVLLSKDGTNVEGSEVQDSLW